MALLKIVKDNLYGMEVPIKTDLRPGMGITPEEIIADTKKILGEGE